MKKLMTYEWFKEMFIEEAKKLFPNSIHLREAWTSYIVEKDLLEEGEKIIEEEKTYTWFGLKCKIKQFGYTFKKYKAIFKFDIKCKDKTHGEVAEFKVYLYINKTFTCEKAESFMETIKSRLEKEEILDKVEFIFIKDSNAETLTTSDSFKRFKSRG